MSVAISKARPRSPSIPDGIESPRAKLVYLYLSATGRGTVDELADDLGMPKMALFSMLGTLTGRDLVERDGETYRLA